MAQMRRRDEPSSARLFRPEARPSSVRWSVNPRGPRSRPCSMPQVQLLPTRLAVGFRKLESPVDKTSGTRTGRVVIGLNRQRKEGGDLFQLSDDLLSSRPSRQASAKQPLCPVCAECDQSINFRSDGVKHGILPFSVWWRPPFPRRIMPAAPSPVKDSPSIAENSHSFCSGRRSSCSKSGSTWLALRGIAMSAHASKGAGRSFFWAPGE